jgi:hypothetical protein
MQHVSSEKELLDQQEALARAGIQLALRGLGVDMIDALSLPPSLYENELFDKGVAAAAGVIGHESIVQLVTGWAGKAVAHHVDARGLLSALRSSSWLR